MKKKENRTQWREEEEQSHSVPELAVMSISDTSCHYSLRERSRVAVARFMQNYSAADNWVNRSGPWAAMERPKTMQITTESERTVIPRLSAFRCA
jgi:hypothetical protein